MKNFIRNTLLAVSMLFVGAATAQPITGPQQAQVAAIKKSCDHMAVMMFDQVKNFQERAGKGEKLNIEQVQVEYTLDMFRKLERANPKEDVTDAKQLVLNYTKLMASYYKEYPETIFKAPQQAAETYHVFCYRMAEQRSM